MVGFKHLGAGIVLLFILACGGIGAGPSADSDEDVIDDLFGQKVSGSEDKVVPIAPGSEVEGSVRPSAAGSEPIADPVPPAKGVQMATIDSAGRGKVTLSGTSGDVPTKGASGELLKKVDTQFGKMSISAWLNIATVEVSSVQGRTVTLTVLEEKSEMTVNGKKTDHFKPGASVKLEWEGASP